MPQISRFYGLIVSMYFDDHNPPHFHVKYGEFEAEIDIRNFNVIEGNLPPKALGLSLEWAGDHKKELLKNWELCKSKKNPFKIKPLE